MTQREKSVLYLDLTPEIRKGLDKLAEELERRFREPVTLAWLVRQACREYLKIRLKEMRNRDKEGE
jgi:hypothetical protein